MKKILGACSLVLLSLLLLVHYVGNIAERETKNALSDLTLQKNSDFNVNLISYQRNFFSATVKTELIFNAGSTTPLIVTGLSKISHLPYKALVVTTLAVQDEKLAKQLSNYFGCDDWFKSTEEVNIFGKLKGELVIAGGKYQSDTETLKTAPLLINYSMDLENKSGEIAFSWDAFSIESQDEITLMDSIEFTLDFKKQVNAPAYQPYKYDYTLDIKKIHSKIEKVILATTYLVENIAIKGSSEAAIEAHRINAYNELNIGNYQLGNDPNLSFKNNHLKFNLLETYEPLWQQLPASNNAVGGTLSKIFNKGLHLSQASFSSKTPWGEVNANLDMKLASGGDLRVVSNNLFMLFDLASGEAHASIPASLLTNSIFSDYLKDKLQKGMIIQKPPFLTFDMQYHQGELLINGSEFPL